MIRLLLATLIFVEAFAGDCVPRDFGQGGSVCVCNATYCDETEPFSPSSISVTEYLIYTSSLSGLRFNATKHFFYQDEGPVDTVFTLGPNKAFQTIQGFGGAFTDSAGFNIVSLSAEAQQRLMESYFGARGNSYSLARIPIGGTDFSNRPYTYADGVVDATLSNFELQTEDLEHKVKKNIRVHAEPFRDLSHFLRCVKFNHNDDNVRWSRDACHADMAPLSHFVRAASRQISSIIMSTVPPFSGKSVFAIHFAKAIPFIKLAQNLTQGSIRFLAAAWTAPPWMKTNNDYIGLGKLKEMYYSAWSDYHMKFLEEYDKHGIEIWALSTGNEPLNGRIPGFSFNCMGWQPKEQRIWVTEHMGPALRQSRFNNTVLMSLDDQRFELPQWLDVLFEGDSAKPYIDGIGVHWYWDDVTSLNLLDKTHDKYPEKWIIATEASYTKKPLETEVVHLGSWQRGEKYAEDIIDDLNHWVAGWVDWNLALDSSGGPTWADNVVDAAVIVNKTADEFYKQPMFYAIGHFSKFVPVGSIRVELTGGSNTVKGVAVLTPDDVYSVVILNKEEIEQVVRLEGLVQGSATFTIPPKSLITFLCLNRDVDSSTER